MEIPASQMRQITDQSRFHSPQRSLPDIKTRKLTWSLEYSRKMRQNQTSRLDELSLPKAPSYAYPENGDYNPQPSIDYLKTSPVRSISPKFPPQKIVERAPPPNAYNPQIQKTITQAKIRASVLKNEFDTAASRANHVGPGWYNPDVGAEFQKQKVGFTMKGREKGAEVVVYSDRLFGQEVYDGIRYLGGAKGDFSINKSERFQGKKSGKNGVEV